MTEAGVSGDRTIFLGTNRGCFKPQINLFELVSRDNSSLTAQIAAASATLGVPTVLTAILAGLGTSTELKMPAAKVFKGQLRS